MGSCESTKNTHKANQYSNSNALNQSKDNKVSYEPHHYIKSDIRSSFTTQVYPYGNCILLRKIQGKIISNADKLKSKVELYVNIQKLPLPGRYTVEFIIKEGKASHKIGSLPAQDSDQKGQLRYSGCIEMEYYFERDQTLEIKFINLTTNTCYEVVEKVGKLASALKKSLVLSDLENKGLEVEFKMIPIKSEKRLVTIDIELLGPTKQQASQDSNLNKKELFYVLKNFNDEQTWRGVYKSEESKNFYFQSVNIYEDDLFLGDESKKFGIEIIEKDHSVPIGFTSMSISDIKEKSGIVALNCPTTSNVSCYVSFKIKFTEQLTFTELLKKGLQISMVVGIDFTGSNGNPNEPSSLHYFGGSEPNSYERAIRSCGNILAYYDSDQSFPAFGFGGIPQGTSETLHIFPLNYQKDPCVNGVNEIVNAYRSALSKTELSGPTYFSPLLVNLCTVAKNTPKGVYHVMMIVTDGEINDIAETIDSIIDCSSLPISVIIIGVGKSAFSNMELLDGDDMPLKGAKGNCVKRDIVQFVPFSKFEKDSSKLAEEVLKELPSQIETYFINQAFESDK